MCFICLVVYLFIFAEPIGTQTFLKPEATSDIVETQNKSSTEKLFPFISNKYFGYFDEDGKIVFAQPKTNTVSISDTMYTQYKAPAFNANFTSQGGAPLAAVFSHSGEQLCTIPADGKVFLKANRIFVFLQSASAITEYDSSGKQLWSYSVNGIITTFDCNEELAVIGSSNGNLVCLNRDGTEKFNFYPGGSEIQIIYGLALSKDGKYLGCLCGLNKQRLILIEVSDYHKIIFHKFLTNGLRKQASIFFDSSAQFLFSETADGLVILNTKNMRLSETDIQGDLSTIAVDAEAGAIGVLTNNKSMSKLSFFDYKCRKIGSTDFFSDTCALIQSKGDFYLIADEKISKIKLDRH